VSGIELPQHASHPWFTTQANQLLIAGQTVSDLAKQIGRTPFYAYQRSTMTQKVELLRRALPPQIHLHYAIKANPMLAVVRHLSALVDGLDVASVAELQVALDAGAQPSAISFAGPGKTNEELSRAAAAGITINVESEREVEELGRIGTSCAQPPLVAIRVNPDFELKTSGMKMGGGPKQFGIDAERVPDVLRRIATLPLTFRGFHIFAGSQNLRAAAIIEAQRKTVDLAIRLAEHAPAPVTLLNMGGGFGIPYFPGEQPLDLVPIADHLRDLVPRLQRSLPAAEIVLELGRYLVGESGIYVCRVVDRKVSRGHVFLITDGGLHHHLAASGNFGQVIRKNYPVLVAGKVEDPARETVSVVGPLCTPLDLLADRVELPRADVGDLIAVLQSGAYGLTASPLRFLSHPPPEEVLV
jgi:diaminopimelate decarboxylase